MNLWGVAVLEPDCNPDYNKGPDHAPQGNENSGMEGETDKAGYPVF